MKILGIDFDSVFRRAWEAEDGKEMGAAHRRTVESIARMRDGYDRIVIACDSGASFRKSKVESYKEGRTNPGAAYFEQRRRTVERLKVDGCIVIEGPAVEGGNAEADDVLGWLAMSYAKHCRTLADDAVNEWWLRIVSGDGDLEQLVSDGDGVDLQKPSEREAWKESHVLAKRGVTPDKIVHLKALCGDKSDNYPGFVGIGEKTAAALLAKFGDALAAVAGADDTTIKLTAPQREVLKTGGVELAARGLYLATLKTDLPLDFAALVFPEPVIGTIAGDEPLGGEPTKIDTATARDQTDPRRRPGPPSNEPAPSREMQVAPGFGERVEATSPHDLQIGKLASQSDALAMRPMSSTALASFGPLDLQPGDLESAWRLTKPMFEARIYPQYPNREAMLAVMLDARERGIPMCAALRSAYIVKGRVGWSAAFFAGLVLSSGKADFFELVPESCDETKAAVRFKRKGRAEGLHKFTIEDARKAGYLQSNMWEKEPKAMLRAAAVRTAARAYFPDVTSGMYMPDEIRGHAEDSDMGAANV